MNVNNCPTVTIAVSQGSNVQFLDRVYLYAVQNNPTIFGNMFAMEWLPFFCARYVNIWGFLEDNDGPAQQS